MAEKLFPSIPVGLTATGRLCRAIAIAIASSTFSERQKKIINWEVIFHISEDTINRETTNVQFIFNVRKKLAM